MELVHPLFLSQNSEPPDAKFQDKGCDATLYSSWQNNFGHIDDLFSKETSPPKESTCSEEETQSNEIINKVIQKIPKTSRIRRSKTDIITSTPEILLRERREVKKPTCGYEKTQLQDEQRRKALKSKKKKIMKEKLINKSNDKCSQAFNIKEGNSTEISSKNRDWELFFQQELQNLSQQEFLSFLKMIYQNYPECVSFEKGYAELKLSSQLDMKDDKVQELNQMIESNSMYLVFSRYLEQVKKQNCELEKLEMNH